MTRRSRKSALLALGASAVLAATMAVPAAAQEAAPMPTTDITVYPNYGGEVDCAAGTFNGAPYSGNLKSITAPDPMTVVFEFCNPNVAFLSQIAFSALAIDDAAHLIAHGPDGSILETPNGTGPYKFSEWDRGNRITYVANDAYWGEKALTPNLEIRWSDQAAQRLVELQAGTVDGIDNPGTADFAAIEADSNLAIYPREGLNTFYLGMNNSYAPWDNAKVRQAIALGIDRERIVANFYPPGSSVASHFTPCAIPFGCDGEPVPSFDLEAAKALLAEAGYPDGFETKIQYRSAVRGYLPDPPTIAQEIATQLENNLGIRVTLEEQESGTFLDNNAAGALDGIFLLGWGADYPDASNFLDYHFGPATGDKFGAPYEALVAAVKAGGESSDDAERSAAYGEANRIIAEQVPAVVVAHGGSATAFKADIEGAHASPLGNEQFSAMKAGDRDTLSWMQNAEPLSLYCADETDGETFRACQPVMESLYQYAIGGTATEPALATACTANEDLTVWTCTLREGVTFHDGSTLDASDVIVSFAAQWDVASPLHVGRTATFEYWPSLIGGGYLNPPAE